MEDCSALNLTLIFVSICFQEVINGLTIRKVIKATDSVIQSISLKRLINVYRAFYEDKDLNYCFSRRSAWLPLKESNVAVNSFF